MSDNYPKSKSRSNIRFSEVITEGIKFFFQNWGVLLVIVGLFFIISLIIKNLLVVDLNWQVQAMLPAIEAILVMDPTLIGYSEIELMFDFLLLTAYSMFLNDIFTTVLNVVAMCLVSNYLYNKFIGKESRILPELKKALNARLLLVVLLLGVGISVGSILLFIPSVILLGFYIFYIFTYHFDDSESPLKDARGIARGAFWKIFGIFVVNYLIIFVIDTVYHLIIDNFLSPVYNPLWYNPLTRDFGAIILYEIIYNIVQVLFAPLFICLLTSLYVSLKTRIEQYILPQTSNLDTSDSDGILKIENSNTSGMYCPFCGSRIKKKSKFCINCGEKLDFLYET